MTRSIWDLLPIVVALLLGVLVGWIVRGRRTPARVPVPTPFVPAAQPVATPDPAVPTQRPDVDTLPTPAPAVTAPTTTTADPTPLHPETSTTWSTGPYPDDTTPAATSPLDAAAPDVDRNVHDVDEDRYHGFTDRTTDDIPDPTPAPFPATDPEPDPEPDPWFPDRPTDAVDHDQNPDPEPTRYDDTVAETVHTTLDDPAQHTTTPDTAAPLDEAATDSRPLLDATEDKDADTDVVHTAPHPVVPEVPEPELPERAEVVEPVAQSARRAEPSFDDTEVVEKPTAVDDLPVVATEPAAPEPVVPEPVQAEPVVTEPVVAPAATATAVHSGATAADDFRRLAGVGPKVAAALHTAGIHTFAQLADTDVPVLREAMRQAGVRSAPTLPSWPEQARSLAG